MPTLLSTTNHYNFTTLYPFFTGCYNASLYGINCDTPCPTNCKDSTCHIQSGACFNCKPGWTGMNCNTSKMTKIYINFNSLNCYVLFFFQLHLNTFFFKLHHITTFFECKYTSFFLNRM